MKQNRYIHFVLVIFLMASISCGKTEIKLGAGDSLVVGFGGGWCGYYCNTAYKITSSGAYPSKAFSGTSPYVLEWADTAVDNNRYQQLLWIRNNFPAYLLSHPNKNFGCAGCADGSYLFIQYEKNGKLTNWSIDFYSADSMPDGVREFASASYDIIKD